MFPLVTIHHTVEFIIAGAAHADMTSYCVIILRGDTASMQKSLPWSDFVPLQTLRGDFPLGGLIPGHRQSRLPVFRLLLWRFSGFCVVGLYWRRLHRSRWNLTRRRFATCHTLPLSVQESGSQIA